MQSLRDSISHFTPLSLTLSLLLFLGYIIALLVPKLKPYVALTPWRASYAVWTCTTSSFLVLNPLELVLDIIVLLFVGQIIEPVLGKVEMMKYLLIVAAMTGIATFAVAYTTFVIGRSVAALYGQISSFRGLLGAMLVAFKQLAPDHTIVFCDLFRIRAEWLASVYVLLGLPLGVFYRPLNYFPFLLFGTYFSWFYLRFLQVDPRTQLRGDPSPSFNFASFFPELLRPVVNKIASFCSSVFHIQPKQQAPVSYNLYGTHNSTAFDLHDQARRRERGQKALDARLSGLNGLGQIASVESNDSDTNLHNPILGTVTLLMDFLNRFANNQFILNALFKSSPLDRRLQAHVQKVYATLAVCVIFAGFGVFLQKLLPLGGIISSLLAIGCVTLLNLTPPYQENTVKRHALLFGTATLVGWSTGPLVLSVMHLYPSVVVSAFLMTFVVFASFSASALVAKRRSMLYLSSFCSIGLTGLVFYSFAAQMIGLSYMAEIYIGLIVFSLYILVDTQIIVERAAAGDGDHVTAALELFLDFIHVFVRILVILADKKDKEDRKEGKRR